MKRRFMKWKDLSNEAKNIIEWVEDPYSNHQMTIEIKIGEYFQPEGDNSQRRTPTKILVTSEIYQEVIKFVASDKELQCEQFTDSFIFRIKDNSKLKLH